METSTKENLNFAEREFRVFLGTGLILSILLIAPQPMGYWSLLLLAAIPTIASAVVGWDPLYALLGRKPKITGEKSFVQRHWSFSNMGVMDRFARLAIGGTLIAMVIANHGGLWGALIAIPVVTTAIMSWDPIYALTGFNTFSSKQDAVITGELNTTRVTAAVLETQAVNNLRPNRAA